MAMFSKTQIFYGLTLGKDMILPLRAVLPPPLLIEFLRTGNTGHVTKRGGPLF